MLNPLHPPPFYLLIYLFKKHITKYHLHQIQLSVDKSYLIYPFIKHLIINILVQDLLILAEKNLMSNPFAALQIYGEDQEVQAPVQRPKKVTEPRKQEKPKQGKRQQPTNQADNIPTRIRDNATVIRNKREPKPTKEIGEGHTLDRRSGTGRVDRPRKQGGGRGGIGNLRDQQNKEKYIKENEEDKDKQEKPVEQTKPEQPKGLTLQEYYRNKGIELQNLASTKKEPVKKGQVTAEWIKKEKLTVMHTKEDKKISERQVQTSKKQFQQQVAEQEESNQALLGFKSKAEQRPREEQRDNKDKPQAKGAKKQKVNLKEEDFPSL